MSHVTCHVSRVTCHMSRVTCHVSRVTCHMSCVTFFYFLFLYFYFLPSPPKKNYWSYDPHRSRDSVSPVCGIFFTEHANKKISKNNFLLFYVQMYTFPFVFCRCAQQWIQFRRTGFWAIVGVNRNIDMSVS